jgi:hypothetical protein
MNKQRDNVYSTRHVEGVERATALILHNENGRYRCYRWAKFHDHWLLELTTGDQVELYGGVVAVHIPRDGYTFELDGSSREVQRESAIIQ